MFNPKNLVFHSKNTSNLAKVKLPHTYQALLWALLTVLASSSFSVAQQSNSPYSFLGIGESITEGTAVNSMMGGLGVTNATGLYINNMNPALLARNRFTMFEMGVSTEAKAMQNNGQRSSTYQGTIAPISIALPVSSRWTMLLGLRPSTRVDYASYIVNKLDPLGVDSVTYSYNGSGGLNKAVIGNGVRVSKNIYVGIETAFTFGVINHDITSQNWSDNQRYQVKLSDRTNYSGLNYKLGFVWRPQLSKEYFLNVGGTAEFGQSLNANNIRQFLTLTSSGLSTINADTLTQIKNASVTLPATYRFGVSLEKPGQLVVSLDYSMTQWTSFKNISGSNEGLKNAYTVAVGAEYIPKFDAISGYFNHVAYRVGASFTQSPYTLTGTTGAKDYNFSVGASFPLRTISYMNLGIVHGKRGVLSTNGLEEQYTKIVLGFSLGDFNWFRKPKID